MFQSMLPMHRSTYLKYLLAIASWAASAASAQPVTLVDENQRVTVLAKPAERVVTIPLPAAAMLMTVDGGSRRLVGMNSVSKSAIEEGILKKIFPASLEIRSDVAGDGFMPNVETLLEARPDLVLQWGDRGRDVIEPMTRLGIPVATIKYGSIEGVHAWLRLMGKALGRDGNADRMIRWSNAVLADMRSRTNPIPEAEKPRVVYFLRFLSGMQVAGRNTNQDFDIHVAGGKNPAEGLSDFKLVNMEQILSWDPEVILLNNFETGLTPQDVYSNPLFSSVSAVKHRRVYKMPLGGYRWDAPSHESPLNWEWLATILHPHRFDLPLRDRITEAYSMIYNYTPTADDLDRMLRIDINEQSAHYRRLMQ